jgi:hypothetical protein
MFNIRVERVVKKHINDVFEILVSHEDYGQLPGIKSARLLEFGREERNGEGALREVDLGALVFQERITHFERPYQLNYLIESSKPLPVRHDLGEIRLCEEGEFTRVVWVSKGHIRVPLLGNLLFDKLFNKQGTAGFHSVLKSIEHR